MTVSGRLRLSPPAARAAIERWFAQLTWRGRLCVALGAVSIVIGFALGQLIFVRVAVLFLFLPLVCLLLVRRTRHELRATRRIVPPRIAVGEDATVHIAVENNSLRGAGLLLAGDSLPIGLSGQSRFVIRSLAAAAVSEAQYTVHGVVRGHHDVGPLSLRLADSFGMCAVDRSMTGSEKIVVVPAVHALPDLRRWPDSSASADTRSNALPQASSDDLSVREYRRGDSLRRVNWRVTARRGELMVRQEEHPPQTRAAILLDTRAGAHRGEGPDASLEWAITAVASVAVHLFDRRFSLRLCNENGAGLGGLFPELLAPGPAAEGMLLDGLAKVTTSNTKRLTEPGKLPGLGSDAVLIAVVGEMSQADVEDLAARRRSGTMGIAVVLDVPGWDGKAKGRKAGVAEERAAVLRQRRWNVVVVRQGDDVADAWGRATAGSRAASHADAEEQHPRGAA
ncbi:MAG: DUF58 domain-containing protein [Sporichthyaceae bacterium]